MHSRSCKNSIPPPPSVPEDLLKIICCNCKQNCESKVAIVSDMVLPVPFVVVNVVELIDLILPLVRFWTVTELPFMNFKTFTVLQNWVN